jgi:RNA polymerase sigma-70 factor (ECF subfamily)
MLVFHERWLRTVVASRLGERQAVDEVMQEVSVAVLATRSVVDPSRVAGWLYRLAIRQTLLYRRSRGRQHKLAGRYAERVRDQEDSGRPDPLGWLLLDERLALVRDAMARLPPRDAEILLLKYTENWSCRDLAEHLGQQGRQEGGFDCHARQADGNAHARSR